MSNDCPSSKTAYWWVVSREDIAQASPSKATTFSVGELTYLLARTKIKTVMKKNPVTIVRMRCSKKRRL